MHHNQTKKASLGLKIPHEAFPLNNAIFNLK